MKWLQQLFGKSVAWDGGERRAAFRVRCDFELELRLPGASYFAHCRDAGPRGLKLKVRGPFLKKLLRPGRAVALRYLQPILGADHDTVGASIRWVKRESESQFTLAVAFDDDLETLKRSWVRPVLQRIFRSSSRRNQRQTMRARCQILAKLLLDGQGWEVKVTDLSTSGARVSCLQPLEVGSLVELNYETLQHRALIRRCQPDYGVFRLGLAFAPDEQARQSRLRLLKRLLAHSDGGE